MRDRLQEFLDAPQFPLWVAVTIGVIVISACGVYTTMVRGETNQCATVNGASNSSWQAFAFAGAASKRE
jgi:hypothetical protein